MKFLGPSKRPGVVFDIHGPSPKKSRTEALLDRFLPERVLNLRPNFYRRYRVPLIMVLIVSMVTGGLVIQNALTNAETSDFYPAQCLGTWQNPQNAQGPLETFQDGIGFTTENSAFYDPVNPQGELFCGGFIPLDYSDGGAIESVVATMVWQVGEPVLASTTEPIATSTVPAQPTSLRTVPRVLAGIFPRTVHAQSENPAEAPVAETPTLEAPASEGDTEPLPGESAPSEDPSPTSEPEAEPVPVASSTDVLEPATTTTTSTITEATTTVIAPTVIPDEHFARVSYSFDGQLWQDSQLVDLTNWSHFTITMPSMTWNDLRHVQFRIERLPTSLGTVPPIYLDGMVLEIQHHTDSPVAALISKIFEPDDSPVDAPTVKLSPDQKPVSTKNGKDNFQGDEAPTFEFDLDTLPAPSSTISSSTEPAAVSTTTATSTQKSESVPLETFFNRQRGTTVSTIPPTRFTYRQLANFFLSFFNFRQKTYAQVDAPPPVPTLKHPVVSQIFDPAGNLTNIEAQITDVNNRLRINVPEPPASLKPGKYIIKLWILKNNVIYETQTEFTWGVLALNFDKATYRAGDVAHVGLGLVDDNGHTLCKADLSLLVTAPSGKHLSFSTSAGTIVLSDVCGPVSVTNEADYQSQFKVDEVGEYAVTVRAVTDNGTREFSDSFHAEDSPEFEVTRLGATRIYPPANYDFIFRIKSKQAFQGLVAEVVPASFEVTSEIPHDDIVVGELRTITWHLTFQEGEERDLRYTFKAPDISPEFYKLGPLTFTNDATGSIWKESRRWQIAADAISTSGLGLLVYGDTVDDDNVNVRFITGTSTIGSELTSVNINAETFDIVHAVVKAAPTRSEFVEGHMMTNGRLAVIQYNGSTWKTLFDVASTTAAQVCDATRGSCNRAYDIGYEQLSGKAMIFYGKAANDGILYYRSWDGNASSSEQSITFYSTSTADTSWIKVVPDGGLLMGRRTNRMMVMVSDAAGSFWTGIWNGDTQTFIATKMFKDTNNPTSVKDGRPFDGIWFPRDVNLSVASSGSTAAAQIYYSNVSGTSTQPLAWAFFNETNASLTFNGNPGFTISSTRVAWVEAAAEPTLSLTSMYVALAATGFTATGTGQGWPIVFLSDQNSVWGGFGDLSLESEVVSDVNVAWARASTTSASTTPLITFNDAAASDSAFWRVWSCFWPDGCASSVDVPGSWTDDGSARRLIPSPNGPDAIWIGVDSDNDLRVQRWDGTQWQSAPSAELSVSVGTSTDTSAAMENDAFDFAYTPYVPWSMNWRWYADSTSDTPASALAAENVQATGTAINGGKVRLRINIKELGGNSQIDSRKILQFTTSTDAQASTTTWRSVGDVSSSSIWRYYDCDSGSAVCDDGTVVASTVLTTSTVAGWWNLDENATASSSMDHASGTTRELEFPIESNGAATSTTYRFRLYDLGQLSPVYPYQASFPSSTCAGGTACTYPSIQTSAAGNSTPVVSAVTLNHGNAIVLTPNVTTTIDINFTVTDSDGCSDVFTSGNVTTTVFRSGVGASCSGSNLSCYIKSTNTNSCTSGTSANATATVDIYYFANATDSSSTFSSENWQASVTAVDGSAATGTATSTGVELNTLLAFNITTSSINYGTVAPSSTTGATNRTSTVQNAGNSSSTLRISGTALVSGGQSIATSSQHYASSSFTFGGNEQVLSDTVTTVAGFTLTTPTSTTAVQRDLYWGLQVFAGIPIGTYTGQNTFTALFSP